MDQYKINLLSAAAIVLSWAFLVSSQTTQAPSQEFPPLNRSDMLRAQALIRWLVDNRTENDTHTFNAGFIRLAFHDCVGGCDGCVNLRNPSNAGLGFYKEPLDLMYQEFIVPIMSRADWYALAGITAVEYAAELTPCTGRICKPPMTFKFGRKDCVNETLLFRRIPGPNNDPRETIRRTFRMNLLEITALMGAHTLGKHHANGASWVTNESRFDNQYYKDMINSTLAWRKGVRQGPASSTWSQGVTGKNIMLDSDFFMGFDLGTGFGDCNNNPIVNCPKSDTYEAVERFAGDNDYWIRNFGTAFSVMLNNGNFGGLKDVIWDTFNDTYVGDIFVPRNPINTTTTSTTTTPSTTTTTTSTTTRNNVTESGAADSNSIGSTLSSNNTSTDSPQIITTTGDVSFSTNLVSSNITGSTTLTKPSAPSQVQQTSTVDTKIDANTTRSAIVANTTSVQRTTTLSTPTDASNTTTQLPVTTTGILGETLALTFSNTTTSSNTTSTTISAVTTSNATTTVTTTAAVTTSSSTATTKQSTATPSVSPPPRAIIENSEGNANTGDPRLGYSLDDDKQHRVNMRALRKRLRKQRRRRRKQNSVGSSGSDSSSNSSSDE